MSATINLDRTIAEQSFEYGEHEVVIEVSLKFGYLRNSGQLSSHDGVSYYAPRLGDHGSRVYYRQVDVRAEVDGENEPESKNTTRVQLENKQKKSQPFWKSLAYLLGLREEWPPKKVSRIPPLDVQIEATTLPVLEQVDELYSYLDKDYDIEIDVGMEKVQHEVSWIEVEDEIDRISREIDGIAGVADD